MKQFQLLFSILLLFLFSNTGCKKKSEVVKKNDNCAKLYKIEKKCTGGFNLEKKQFLSICRMNSKTNLGIKEDFSCLKETSCSNWKKCQNKVNSTYIRSILDQRIQLLFEKGNLESAFALCKKYRKITNSPPNVNCTRTIIKLYNKLAAKLETTIDSGAHWKKQCSELKYFAKKYITSELKNSKKLCLEAKFSRRTKKAILHVKKYIKKKRYYLPPECKKKFLSKYDKTNKFVKILYGDLIKACYEELGETILKKFVPKMRRRCKIKSFYNMYKSLKLDYPKFKKLIKKASKVCDKKKRRRHR